MLRVFSGIGSGILTVFMCYVIYSIIMDGGFNVHFFASGYMVIILGSLPFLVVGSILSHLILKRNDKYGLLISVGLGIALAITALLIFRFYERMSITCFIVATSIAGAIANYFGWKVEDKGFAYALAAVVPFVLVLLLF